MRRLVVLLVAVVAVAVAAVVYVVVVRPSAEEREAERAEDQAAELVAFCTRRNPRPCRLVSVRAQGEGTWLVRYQPPRGGPVCAAIDVETFSLADESNPRGVQPATC